MAFYTGLVNNFTVAGQTTVQTIKPPNANVPNAWFEPAQYICTAADGVSGSFGVTILGTIGGLTYIIAGRSGISAVGAWPVPLVTYVGTSGTNNSMGSPRPSEVVYEKGSSAAAGYTASVFLQGRY